MRVGLTSFDKDKKLGKKKGGIFSSVSEADKSHSAFSNAMKIEADKSVDYNYEINQLKNEIEEVGDGLAENPSMEEFVKYKNLIKSLTKKVIDKAYKLRQIGLSVNRQYKIVSTIDSELEGLYKMLIKEQRNNIEITNKVIRLKGLIIDILS